MNTTNINKLKLLLLSLQNRFIENNDLLNHIQFSFKSGVKTFSGKAYPDNLKLIYCFNNNKELISIENFLNLILKECINYDSLSLQYVERCETLLFECNDKNVTVKNVESSNNVHEYCNNLNVKNEKQLPTNNSLNQNINPNEIDLLKQLGIANDSGKIKKEKVKKYKEIMQFINHIDSALTLFPNNKIVNILDHACGKSYLLFILNYYLTEIKKRKCYYIGIDNSETVINSYKSIANNLNYRNMDFMCCNKDTFKYNKEINIVTSINGSHIDTDMALAFGIELEAEVILSVPSYNCETSSQYSYTPLKSILQHNVLKSKMDDVIIDGMRALMLKAKGYNVSISNFEPSTQATKNVVIKAVKEADENTEALNEYMSLMSLLNIYPKLYELLNSW